jgi:hypothetical protein
MAEAPKPAPEARILTGEINLTSSDGKKFKADYACMDKASQVVKEFFKEAKQETEMPLEKVNGSSLEKIISFYTHYKDKAIPKVEKPLKSNKLEAVIKDEWLCKFLEMPIKDLKELIMAANYMGLAELEELVGCTIASKIMGKNVEEFRTEFGVVKDFTEDEEKKLKEFFAWADQIWP